jgi:Tol biopolymer transport system component
MTRVTNHPATDWWPLWSPDDREIAFASDRAGQSTIFKAEADGTGEAQQVYRGDVGVLPLQWLSDGRILFFRDVRIDESGAVLSTPVGRSAPPETVISAPSFRINDVAVSPDGQLFAYMAFDRDGPEVYVSKRNGEQFKISSGGVQPFWRRDGRELYYATTQGDIMAVAVLPGPVFGQPGRLMRPCQNTAAPSFSVTQGARQFAMTADGQRVLAICDEVSTPQITVALGWQSRLR